MQKFLAYEKFKNVVREGVSLNDKLLSRYVCLICHGKSKRIRKKAFSRAVKLAGLDSEGLINYAKIAIMLMKHKSHKKFAKERANCKDG